MNPIENVLSRLDAVKQTGKGWIAKCPGHDDQEPSLSIDVGEDGRVLLNCFGGCTPEHICESIKLCLKDLFPQNVDPKQRSRSGKIIAEYSYHDADGNLLFQTIRYEPKDFRQRRPDGKGGWIWNLKGIQPVLYRLPKLLAAPPEKSILICEGEKDVENVTRKFPPMLIATTSPMGAKNWSKVDHKPLHGRTVYIVPDNDDVGRRYARDIAKSLYGKAMDIKIILLPDLPEHGDISDWIEKGGNFSGLLDLARQTSSYEPPMDQKDLMGIDVPSEDDSYRPFPTEILTEGIRELVEEGAQAIGCDPSFIALPVLAALSAAIGNTRCVRIKADWFESAVLWPMIVGNSGSMKSPAFDLALRAINARQDEAVKQYQKEMTQYEQDLARYEDETPQKKKKGNITEGLESPCPTMPILSSYRCQDITVEALAVVLQDNPRGLLVARDELSGWIKSFDQYKKGRGGDSAHWLEMHRAGALRVDRKGSPLIYVPRAFVSITGGIQPQILKRVLGVENIENGLAARLLLAMPPQRQKVWTEAEVSDDTKQIYGMIFGKLFDLDFDYANGEPKPCTIKLSPEAKNAFIFFLNAHNELLYKMQSSALRAVYSKLEGYAARIALVFHQVKIVLNEHTSTSNKIVPEQIDLKSMESAIVLIEWFRQEIVRIYRVLGMLENDEQEDGHALEELIREKGGRITVRELMHTCRKYRHDHLVAKEALERLVRAGKGKWILSPFSPQGGRPSDIFELFS